MSAANDKCLLHLVLTHLRSLDTYTVKLPSNLPPTYRGRTLRFSYQLSVGACRATAGAGAPSSQSRVMKVPIRIYNHVSGRLVFNFHLIELTGDVQPTSHRGGMIYLRVQRSMVGGWKGRSKKGHGTCLNVRALSCLLFAFILPMCFESITVIYPTTEEGNLSGLYQRSKDVRLAAIGARFGRLVVLCCCITLFRAHGGGGDRRSGAGAAWIIRGWWLDGLP